MLMWGRAIFSFKKLDLFMIEAQIYGHTLPASYQFVPDLIGALHCQKKSKAVMI